MRKGFKLDLSSTALTSPKYSLAGKTGEAGSKFVVAIEKPSADEPLGIDIEKRGQSLLVKFVKDGAVKEWNAKNPFKAIKPLDNIVSVGGKGGTSAELWDRLKEAEGRVEVGVTRNAEAAPGPGKYGAPSVEERFKRQPSFTFGGDGRGFQKAVNKDDRRGRIPGPGSYTVLDPGSSTSSKGFGFGSAARIPVKKPTQSPDPGAYTQKKGTLLQRHISLGGKRTGKRSQSTPAPGQYMPIWSQIEKNDGNVLLDTQEDRQKAAGAQDAFRATLPGPGAYPMLKELGGNIVTNKSPDFSMGAKRKPLRPDQADVNFHISHYTQF